MYNKFVEFFNYKLFSEQLLTERQRDNFLNLICEVAELEFLAKLPRNFKEKEILSYIDKLRLKYNVKYNSRYLTTRWEKIFKNNLYKSTLDANIIILKRDKKICQYCNRTNNLQIHHVIPKDEKKYRGADSYYNLVLACEQCNIGISNTIVLPRNWWLLHSDSKYAPKHLSKRS